VKAADCNYLLHLHRKYINKGDISNIITFIIMIVGIALKVTSSYSLAIEYVLAFGLFGFAGGLTNWLAVKMLFDRVPGLIGSGVIPRQFKEIRRAVKDMVMKMFFDKQYIESYIADRSKSFIQGMDLPGMIKGILNGPDIDDVLLQKLTDISNTPAGSMLATFAPMFGGLQGLVPTIKPMVVAFAADMGGMLADKFDPVKMIPVDKVLQEVEKLMEDKLQLLTPESVKTLMEEVIRQHLGWLVVWGNVFGGLIGIICLASGLQLGHHSACSGTV
jgi:hypothetical protein